jgi:hypothetical protein
MVRKNAKQGGRSKAPLVTPSNQSDGRAEAQFDAVRRDIAPEAVANPIKQAAGEDSDLVMRKELPSFTWVK